MKKHFLNFSILVLVLCATYGCSTSTAQRLNRLDIGMSQVQVKKILGDNYIAQASTVDTNGSRLQLWEYTDQKNKDAYCVYFKDGQLVQWGQKGKLDFPQLNTPK